MDTPEFPSGDRNPGMTERFPEKAFYHVTGSGVLDVTKPPFNARGDGVTDDTGALRAALTFVRTHLPVATWEGKTFCSERRDRSWIVYLPAGTYLISDTVSQNWPARVFNLSRGGWSHCEYMDVMSPEHEWELYRKTEGEVPVLHSHPLLKAADDNNGCYIRGQYPSHEIYDEVNWGIRIIGENREKTVIRLKDQAPGFEKGNLKPAVANVLLERGSNVNIGNFVENLTIDTGRGNPGAAALRWNSSNYGGVRNVRLISADNTGAVGLLMDRNNATGFCRDLDICGFDTGIRSCAGRETVIVMEYTTIEANCTGLDIGAAGSGGGGDLLSARKVKIRSERPVICRQASQLVLLDSELAGGKENCGIEVLKDGLLLARRITLNHMAAAVRTADSEVKGREVKEFFSHPAMKAGERWTELDIEDVPGCSYPADPSEWAVVEDYGAAGDGITDDTSAVQKAMDSGKKVVFFSRPLYMINGTVRIPANVCEIAGLYSMIVRHRELCKDPEGIFHVTEDSAVPLRIRRFTSAGAVFADHAGKRDLVLEDIFVIFNHTRPEACRDDLFIPLGADPGSGVWKCSRNPDPDETKREFVNNCIMPLGAYPDGTGIMQNVHYWGRMLDSEHIGSGLYAFENSKAWIFGFKSENTDTLIFAKKSRMEVLGGSLLEFEQKKGPVIRSEDSEVSALFYLWHQRIIPEIIYCKGEQNMIAGKELLSLDSEDAVHVVIQ